MCLRHAFRPFYRQPIVPPVVTQERSIVETMYWVDVWGLDSGGAVSTAYANTYLAKMRAAGVLGVCYNASHPDWSVPLIRAAGLKAYYYDYAWYAGYDGVGALFGSTNTDVYHGGTNTALAEAIYAWPLSVATAGQKVDALRHFLHCPNYRGAEFQAAIDRAVYYCDTYAADLYVTDSEQFARAGVVGEYLNDRTVGSGHDTNGDPATVYNAITDCSRCVNVAGYVAGWQDMQNAMVAGVRAVRPGIPVHFYNNHTEGTLSEYFYHSWNNPVIVAMPSLYDTFRPTKYATALGSTFASSQAYLAAALDLVSVKGGYPWFNPFETTTGRTATDAEWVDCCGLLADAGAVGFSMFPSSYGLTADQTTDYYRLLKLGIDVFNAS